MCALVANIFRGIVDHGNSLRLGSLHMRRERANLVKTFCLLVSPVLHFGYIFSSYIISNVKSGKSNFFQSSGGS